jgi:putative polyhydroxyalkanoate system protein
MPRIKYQCRYEIDGDEARRRLQQLMDEFGRKYGFKTSWVGNGTVDVKGRGVRGSMEVRDGQVSLDLDLSFLLSPFKAKIEDGIVRKIEQALLR